MLKKYPVTNAIRALRQAGLTFEPFTYAYEARGGTAASARALGVDEHQVIKTLILEDELKRPLIALMHGDCEVSLKNLARLHQVKSIQPCQPQVADRQSGYQVGGTSPLGTKKKMPVYAQASIQELDAVFINGGKRGFLVKLAPQPLLELLAAKLASFAA